MIDEAHIQRFAAVYAEAALTFLETREAQWLAWDGQSHAFDFGSTEMDAPPIPAILLVDEHWTQVIGEVAATTDPESPDFDADALRSAIVAQIESEGFGERLLLGFQERLDKLASGDEDEEDDEDSDPDQDAEDDR
ncbi:MAG TPA: hypothetical protein VFB36_09555 [Nevskiaceae bacterium]|nr:hypothetical protein [Nevskiaceae bacterium]